MRLSEYFRVSTLNSLLLIFPISQILLIYMFQSLFKEYIFNGPTFIILFYTILKEWIHLKWLVFFGWPITKLIRVFSFFFLACLLFYTWKNCKLRRLHTRIFPIFLSLHVKSSDFFVSLGTQQQDNLLVIFWCKCDNILDNILSKTLMHSMDTRASWIDSYAFLIFIWWHFATQFSLIQFRWAVIALN